MARLAADAGFKALYMGGGSLGWLKCVTEANLSLTEMIEVSLDMRAVCPLPIVLDVGGGFGDPVHLHRTVALSEAAGIAAIELEDQLLPRRVEHHAGIDHLVPTELMLEKIKEAWPRAPTRTLSSSPAPMRRISTSTTLAAPGLQEGRRRHAVRPHLQR